MKYQIYRDGEPRETYPAALFNNSPAGALEEYCRVYGLHVVMLDLTPLNAGVVLAAYVHPPNHPPLSSDSILLEVMEAQR